MKFIGFYWTLPVPWAGFVNLPNDPDAAAAASRTIRYQVERVRRWVKSEHGTLVVEKVFLELHPDRGSEQIVPEIDRMIALSKKMDAQLVLVDFAEAMRWRKHGPLWDRLNQSGRCIPLDPISLMLDHKDFDPVQHFRSWRQIDDAHTTLKPEARAVLQTKIADLKAQGSTYKAIATDLNNNGMRTANSKLWTADNVRKLLSQK